VNLSDLKAFEAWFCERVGVSIEEAERWTPSRMDVRTIKAAYMHGLTRGTQETLKVMSRPLAVDLPAPLVQVVWRWKYRADAPPGHEYSMIFTDDNPGPPAHAVAAAHNSSFGPVTVQKVYILKEDLCS
jgi:hypothetical protein